MKNILSKLYPSISKVCNFFPLIYKEQLLLLENVVKLRFGMDSQSIQSNHGAQRELLRPTQTLKVDFRFKIIQNLGKHEIWVEGAFKFNY
jgi:hypothetical protein